MTSTRSDDPAGLSRKTFLQLGAGVTGALAAATALPTRAAASPSTPPAATFPGNDSRPHAVTWDDR